MLFNSYFFIFVFLPTCLVALLAARRWSTVGGELAILVGASLLFYGWWSWADLSILSASVAINYFLALIIGRSEQRFRHPFLVLGIATNLLVLGYFKYFNFFTKTLNAVSPTPWSLHDVALPLAISFFTFQQIANLVDVYRGHAAERNLLRYAFYVTFFPHLIAGPIVYHRDLAPQVEDTGRRAKLLENLNVGLTYFVIGLVQKVLIADFLSPYAAEVFQAAATARPLSAIDAWGGAVAYSFQIYFDFSGYSLMAVGLGRMFGYRFPQNFASPYKALGFIDFWKRWHLSLSRFFRDYVYVPLGGSRGGKFKQARNVLCTMALAGLWHGAAWTFVSWGLLHGSLIAVNHVVRGTDLGRRTARWGERGFGRVLLRGGMFVALTLTWVVFRSENLATLSAVGRSLLFLCDQPLQPRYLEDVTTLCAVFLALFVVVWGLPNAAEMVDGARDGDERVAIFAWRPTAFSAMVLGVAFVLCIFNLSRANEFIYFLF